MYIKTHSSVSSSPKYWSQAVVCLSTPRMYLKIGYFLVKYNSKVPGVHVIPRSSYNHAYRNDRMYHPAFDPLGFLFVPSRALRLIILSSGV